MEFGKCSTLGEESRRCYNAIMRAASSAPAEEREDARRAALWLACQVRDLSDSGRAMDKIAAAKGWTFGMATEYVPALEEACADFGWCWAWMDMLVDDEGRW